MTVKEIANYLFLNVETVKIAITEGIVPEAGGAKVKLTATLTNSQHDITESQADEFISKFEKGERKQLKIATRRELLIEAGHRCGICKSADCQQFHHIEERSNLPHNDPTLMIAICGTCHSNIHSGKIDKKAQRIYKENLKNGQFDLKSERRYRLLEPTTNRIDFSWETLESLIKDIHSHIQTNIDSTSASKDMSEIEVEDKNIINKLSDDYFESMKAHHEPLFDNIHEFLQNPLNSNIKALYFNIVEELRGKIAASRNKFDCFEELLIKFMDDACANDGSSIKERNTLSVVLSFMYFHCDIGRKK